MVRTERKSASASSQLKWVGSLALSTGSMFLFGVPPSVTLPSGLALCDTYIKHASPAGPLPDRQDQGEEDLNAVSESAMSVGAKWSARDNGAKLRMNDSFLEYFKCPEQYCRLAFTGPLSAAKRFFRFAPGNICSGQLSQPTDGPDGSPRDALNE